MDAWVWWLIALAVLVLIEALTMDLVFAMFGAGALVAAVVDGFASIGFAGQTICFVVAAALGLALIRPAALERLKSSPAAR